MPHCRRRAEIGREAGRMHRLSSQTTRMCGLLGDPAALASSLKRLSRFDSGIQPYDGITADKRSDDQEAHFRVSFLPEWAQSVR
jgi:hypothetical protein